MHGMVSRSIQCFLQDTYGRDCWAAIRAAAALDPQGFEAMLCYPPDRTEAMLTAAVARLRKPRESILEDVGTYLVSHPHMQVVRRLLRFSGAGFVEFLYSLEDLPDRARLAVPDLDLPALALHEGDAHSFSLRVAHPLPGFGHVMVGILRAMADDYGALVLLEHEGSVDGIERVSIQLAEAAFARGRDFELRLRTG